MKMMKGDKVSKFNYQRPAPHVAALRHLDACKLYLDEFPFYPLAISTNSQAGQDTGCDNKTGCHIRPIIIEGFGKLYAVALISFYSRSIVGYDSSGVFQMSCNENYEPNLSLLLPPPPRCRRVIHLFLWLYTRIQATFKTD